MMLRNIRQRQQQQHYHRKSHILFLLSLALLITLLLIDSHSHHHHNGHRSLLVNAQQQQQQQQPLQPLQRHHVPPSPSPQQQQPQQQQDNIDKKDKKDKNEDETTIFSQRSPQQQQEQKHGKEPVTPQPSSSSPAKTGVVGENEAENESIVDEESTIEVIMIDPTGQQRKISLNNLNSKRKNGGSGDMMSDDDLSDDVTKLLASAQSDLPQEMREKLKDVLQNLDQYRSTTKNNNKNEQQKTPTTTTTNGKTPTTTNTLNGSPIVQVFGVDEPIQISSMVKPATTSTSTSTSLLTDGLNTMNLLSDQMKWSLLQTRLKYGHSPSSSSFSSSSPLSKQNGASTTDDEKTQEATKDETDLMREVKRRSIEKRWTPRLEERKRKRALDLQSEMMIAKDYVNSGGNSDATTSGFAYDETNVTRAIEKYHEIAQKFPEDNLALRNLATIYETNKFGRFDMTLFKIYVLASAFKGNALSYFSAGFLYGNHYVTADDLISVKKLMQDLYVSGDSEAEEDEMLMKTVESLLSNNNEGKNEKTEKSDDVEASTNDAASTSNQNTNVGATAETATATTATTTTTTNEQDTDLERQVLLQLLKKEHRERLQLNRRLIDQIDAKIASFDPEAMSTLHYFIGTLHNNLKCNIALGYRHMFGYGVPKSCDTALKYYYQAAELVKADFHRGTSPLMEKVRITDNMALEMKQKQEDVMDFYKYNAEQGSPQSQLVVGYAHLYGLRGMPRNAHIARNYFQRAAEAGEAEGYAALGDMYSKGISVPQNNETAFEWYKKGVNQGDASSQNGLGMMYLMGAVPPAPVATAAEQTTLASNAHVETTTSAPAPAATTQASSVGDAVNQGTPDSTSASTTGSGSDRAPQSTTSPSTTTTIDATGRQTTTTTTTTTTAATTSAPSAPGAFTLERNAQMAAKYFNMSAHQGNPDAQFNLAVLYMNGDGVPQSYTNALKYFALAAQQGQTLAKFYIGVLYKEGLGTIKNCQIALQSFKSVVEKGSWLSSIDRAFEDYSQGENYHSALYIYQQYAELGVEVAQSNVAYMFDRGYGIADLMRDHSDENEQWQRAMFWYKRAADQGNVEAHVKVGDYYYYGTSGLTHAVASNHTEQHNMTVQYEKSVFHYRRAADLRNAQAMFNLGIMHEHGLGLPKDFHLAKRYYDMALDTDSVATVPVYMALAKLYVHWGVCLLRDRIYQLWNPSAVSSHATPASTTTGAETSASTPPSPSPPQPTINIPFSERPGIQKLLSLFKLATWKQYYQGMTWERIMQHDDLILITLIGLLLFLAFVRHIYINNMNYRQRQRMDRVE